ncbi:DUF488 domain-containing protein [Phreatobacter sp. AB_2022a]|uniref:DUF488 domain-containing protein n=1 Tax=Phreatobacter sp. AB_2022a TaxID=3003134 RepID=UPI002286DAA2|nr:DUF488 domain-containing protein [Phreatobacter sp. AB_2022a]MCZ0732761.1 DUF488 domain-containing protein [Phreatobacter sp. AB_2022a]
MAKPRIKRVYVPPALEDGARVLVDRVWPRGVSRKAAALASWSKDVAPSAGLRKWFGHDPARWPEFRARYRRELTANPEPVAVLRAMLREGVVTLVYGAHDEEHNNAVVLAELLDEDG